MKIFTIAYELPISISETEFRDRANAYPLLPRVMKTVPYKTYGFLIRQIGENYFEVNCEPGYRRSLRAGIQIMHTENGPYLMVKIWQDWRALIGAFLFLILGVISGLKSFDKLDLGHAIFLGWGFLPLVLTRMSWRLTARKFRKWLRDGLLTSPSIVK